ncbi:RNA-binding domain-containing protein [Lichtheimia hyalospora FSU 10163]|nr:RNA-binding domain-containing protein [Lichtheimia hyalospora FSU 10163]
MMMISDTIVKLPTHNNKKRPPLLVAGSDPKPDFLVSELLYMEGFTTSNISEHDVMELLKSCSPIEINLTVGVLRFPSADQADRAYTLFNGASLKNGIQLQLRINPPGDGCQEPEATSGILQIRNLPLQTTNHFLYNLFRPFGPMSLCKVIMDQDRFKGTALIQYFDAIHADTAVHYMNNKNIQGNTITVSPFVSKKQQQQQQQQPYPDMEYSRSAPGVPINHQHNNKRSSSYTAPSPATTLVAGNNAMQNIDYTNLYIKNLDLSVQSADLFNHFCHYGRIISARVMRNAQTKQSKGFGFVSFSSAEEAWRALHATNQTYIKSKPIVVAFHEPKKPRAISSTSNNNNSSAALLSQSAPSSTMLPYYPPPQPTHTLPPMPTAAAAVQQQQAAAITTSGYHQQQQPVPPSSLVRHYSAPIPQPPPPLTMRSGSPESLASTTATTSGADPQVQRLRLVEAVTQCGEQREVNDIVDMLLTLKRRERSLCLFNRGYLQEKIAAAKLALDTCRDENAREDDGVQQFLDSIKGLTLHEQKQKLGDRLFPCVKATGIKHAPRITIRLLDTVPLEELARIMNDQVQLKKKVDQVIAST